MAPIRRVSTYAIASQGFSQSAQCLHRMRVWSMDEKTSVQRLYHLFNFMPSKKACIDMH